MKILLIDLSALFWRAWHASKDQEIGAAFDYTVGKIRSARQGYDYVAVCCDHAPYKRKAISAEYKAQRDTPDPAAVGQLKRVKDRLEADGYLLWSAEGYEADDIIATACHALTANADDADETSIDILSMDKDLAALVSDRVSLVRLDTGDHWGPNEVTEKFGVSPEMIPELLAFTGDKADNVPGVPGIGPKKAAQLLMDNKFADLANGSESIVAEGATRKAVLENTANIRKSFELVKLMTDAPIDIAELFAEREQKPLGEPIKDEEFDDMHEDEEIETPPANDTPLPPIKPPAELVKNDPNQSIAKPEAVSYSPFETSLEPRTAAQAWALSKAVHESRLFAVESPAQALMIVMTGREMGIGAMSSLRGFHFIKGKPVMSAQLMAALILRSGKAEYWELVESDGKKATYATKRVGGRNEQRKTFSVDDARLAQLVKQDGNWAKYPAAMCEARAAAMLARIVYPDLLMGVYLPDEMDEAA